MNNVMKSLFQKTALIPTNEDRIGGKDKADRRNGFEPAFKVLTVAVVLLGFLPMVRMVYWLYALGGNCIGNDYVHWIKLIDHALAGTLNWLDFPRAVFLGSHFCFFSILAELAMCSLGVWDVRLESLIGICLLCVSTFLLWDATTTKSDGRWRWLVLACSAAINFGTTQSAILLGSMFSLRLTGLCQLGYTIALWALIKFSDKRRNTALILVALGGIVASYSCGAALPVWGSLLVAVVMLGYRRISELAFFFASMFVGLFPYAYFFLVDHKHDPNLAGSLGKVGMDPMQIIDLIGRPLCNGMGRNFGYIEIGHIAGVLGLGFLIAMLLSANRKVLPKSMFTVSISLIAFSAIAAGLLIEVRAQIAPWYATMMKYYWLGFSTLAIYLLKSAWDSSSGSLRPARLISGGIGGAALVCFLTLYLITNVSFDDKQFYLLTRTPASESLQRHYQTAPTYAEDLLFQWGPGNQYFSTLLGSVLQKHGLLSFGPNQEWTLQGDFFLDSVSFNRQPNYSAPLWITGNRADRSKSWRDYDHLNLCLEAPQTVTWRLTVPAGARAVNFETSCARAEKKYHQHANSTAIPVAARVSIKPDSDKFAAGIAFSKPLYSRSGWSKIEIPLTQFAGKDIDVSFSCLSPDNAEAGSFDGAVFQYPRITFKQDRLQSTAALADDVRPENTDVSPAFHRPTAADLILPTLPGSSATVAPAHNLILNQFSHLYFRAATGSVFTPLVSVRLNFKNNPTATVVIPLMLDHRDHAYTYDFKLLALPAGAELGSIDLTASGTIKGEKIDAVISDVRLLRVR
ncbi:MAG TPA: hypothetical protein V6C69_01640 [Trichormus sp.]|jgi:hypothetical protein